MADPFKAYLVFENLQFYIDVVTEESYDHTAEATAHPVEKGADITDHVRQNGDKFTWQGHISNTPIIDWNNAYDLQYLRSDLEAGANLVGRSLNTTRAPGLAPGAILSAGIAGASKLISGKTKQTSTYLKRPSGGKPNVVNDIVTQILYWKRNAILGEVLTEHEHYENVLITGFTVSRDRPVDGMDVTLSFEVIRLVETRLVAAPVPTIVSAKPSVAKGHQGTTPAAPTEEKSVLEGLAESAGVDPRKLGQGLGGLFGGGS